MDSETIRVRFAPSPSGLLHVVNARTALFNWLLARHTGGKFILRIEDIDLDRTKLDKEKQLIQDLVWLGLSWDEGPNEAEKGETGGLGPYHQSKRFEIYSNHTIQLLADGKAYRCFCTQEELDKEREQAIAQQRPDVYSGKCRSLSKAEIKENLLRGKWYSIRLKVPNHAIRFHDAVRGDMEFAPEKIGDPVIVRANWIDALDHVTARGARMLDAYADDENPFMKIGRRTVTVAVTKVVRAAEDAFEIHWEERILETGAPVRWERFTGAVSILFSSASTARLISKNPLGLYVDSFTWRRDSIADASR